MSFKVILAHLNQTDGIPQVNLNVNHQIDPEDDVSDGENSAEVNLPEFLVNREDLESAQKDDQEFSAASRAGGKQIDEELLPEGLLPVTDMELSQEEEGDAVNAFPPLVQEPPLPSCSQRQEVFC